MRPEIIANIQIHPVNLGQQPAGGHAIVLHVVFGPANLRHLPLEMENALLCDFKFVIVLNHIQATANEDATQQGIGQSLGLKGGRVSARIGLWQ